MARPATKQQAIELRKEGHSYSYISEKLGVSKSTLSDWLASVPFIPNSETLDRIGKARTASILAHHRLKQESLDNAAAAAEREMGAFTKRDLFILGLGLYIGEGAKSYDQLRIVNANPAIIRCAVLWFTEVFGMKKEHLQIRLHLYPDNDVKAATAFWAKQTGLSEGQFFRPIIDTRANKKKLKAGKLPHGTAHLSVRSLGKKEFGVFLARKIMAWSSMVLK